MVICVAHDQHRSRSRIGPRARRHWYPRQGFAGYLRFLCLLSAAISMNGSSFSIALIGWLIAMTLSPISKDFTTSNVPWKGEASRVLKSLEMSEDNYAAAWEQLHNRYENKDKRIDHYIEGMFRLPAMKSYSALALRQLVDNFSNHRWNRWGSQSRSGTDCLYTYWK